MSSPHPKPRAPTPFRWEELIAGAAEYRLQHNRSSSPHQHREAEAVSPRHHASSSGRHHHEARHASPSGLDIALLGSTSPHRREVAGARPSSGLDVALRGSATAERPVAKAVPSRGGLDIALRS